MTDNMKLWETFPHVQGFKDFIFAVELAEAIPIKK